jgi:hypothetical protein
MLKDETLKKKKSLKRGKKTQANPGEPPKLGSVTKIHNLWNPRLGLSQEVQFSINLKSNDEIEKNIN